MANETVTETCPTCKGQCFVDDGEITGSGGEPFTNGPIRCVADCPTCKGVGRVAPAITLASDATPQEELKTLCDWVERAAEVLKSWSHTSRLQSFADREKFRAAASKLLVLKEVIQREGGNAD